ncbi:MAG: dephospho-CoA kinase [Oscillospiraceae bacterium]|jgi:dephospho-CoA kinase|nr:dephospho-CoA kinase [Oscillospiraceae bacterium]
MFIVGVTGGSGAGKTALCACLQKLGAAVINADEVYAGLLRRSAPLRRELAERFGTCERRRLSAIVFAEPGELDALNAITAPHTLAAVKRRLHKQKAETVFVEAILLLETELAALCDMRVAVTAPYGARLERAAARDGRGRAEIAQRLKNQKPDSYYAQGCDIVIVNTGSVDALEGEARKLLDEVFVWAQRKRNATG